MTTPELPVLWQFPPAFGLPSLSPFCVKVEMYLRLCGIPYLVRFTNNPRGGPHGKMPFLQHGKNRIADSRAIIGYIDTHLGGGLDAELCRRKKAIGHALQRTVEEHLYFALMASRWVDAAGFFTCSQEFASAFPFGLRRVALRIIRGMMKTQCSAQGFGRLPPQVGEGLAVADIAAIEALIEGPFLFGEKPTSFDASLFAFLQTIAVFPAANALRDRTRASAKLTSYLANMKIACVWKSS